MFWPIRPCLDSWNNRERYLCVSKGLDLVAKCMHMLLRQCWQTLTCNTEREQCIRNSHNCIVQSHPCKELPGGTIHPAVAPAVLPNIRTQLANPTPGRVIHVDSSAQRADLTLAEYRRTGSLRCTSTYDFLLARTTICRSLDTFVSIFLLFQS
jgi:hypothetical protein